MANVKSHHQPAILGPVQTHGRALSFRLASGAKPQTALRRLAADFAPDWGVIGIGPATAAALRHTIAGLRAFPALTGPGIAVPSTQAALWCLLGATDRGLLFERSQQMLSMLQDAFVLEDALDTFKYGSGRDLTGYEDGTENPKGKKAVAAALVPAGTPLAGSSFAAVQRWTHDLARFARFSGDKRDAMIGRRRSDNAEIADAPPSAHVKRTAQESYEPPTFMMRRSMPWATAFNQGLEFIAYGHSLDLFERQLRRMLGHDDGIVDALFRFARPIAGSYYWCPALDGGRLDLSPLGLRAAAHHRG